MENVVSSLEFGTPQTVDRLSILPIFETTDLFLPFLTLEEALERKVLEIIERSEMGSVAELLVRNAGDTNVIILEGEELRGAKQNRIVNTTVIVAAGTEVVVPVSCVERGRWHYTSRRFSSGENVLSPSLRRTSHRSVTKSLRHSRSYRSDQSAVWSEISGKARRMSVESPTEAVADILYARIPPPAEQTFRDEIKHQDSQVGFLAFIGDGFAGGEIFGSAELCRKQMNKLIRGYYLDALDTDLEFPRLKTEQIVSQMSTAEQEEYAAIGMGKGVRFEASDIQGAYNLIDGNVVHLTVLPKVLEADR